MRPYPPQLTADGVAVAAQLALRGASGCLCKACHTSIFFGLRAAGCDAEAAAVLDEAADVGLSTAEAISAQHALTASSFQMAAWMENDPMAGCADSAAAAGRRGEAAAADGA